MKGTLIIGLLILICYAVVDPSVTAWMPKCAFYKLTGFQCPGCGAQRMAHALIHGDFVAAWNYNPFLLSFLPILIFLVWMEFNRRKYPGLYARIYTLPFIIIFSLLILGWFVFRNIYHI